MSVQLFQQHLLYSSCFWFIWVLIFTRQVMMKRKHLIFKCTFDSLHKLEFFCLNRGPMGGPTSQKFQKRLPPQSCFIWRYLEKLLLRWNWEDLLPRGKNVLLVPGLSKMWTERVDGCGRPLGLDVISKLLWTTSASSSPGTSSSFS